jgi:hypothetical protein
MLFFKIHNKNTHYVTSNGIAIHEALTPYNLAGIRTHDLQVTIVGASVVASTE